MLSAMSTSLVVGLVTLVVLVLGAEVVVNKMEAVAKYYGVSEVVIAMTIVSVGTSLPEISLHLVGSYQILAGISSFYTTSATVLGANIGSDVVQQTLVLGLVVLSVGGFKFSRKFLLRDYAPMMGTTLLTLILAWDGILTRIDGGILFGSFVLYMYYLYTTRKEKLQKQSDMPPSTDPRKDLLIGIIAMVAVVTSAHFFLGVVEFFIAYTGLAGSMIGVVTVGVFSAMPEMTTAITGLRKGAEGISLGTLIGSNITNPLLAIGLGSLISKYAVPRPLVLWDLPMETITAAVLLVYLLNKNRITGVISPLFRQLGFKDLSERMQNAENARLTVVGALLLILMYLVYVYVRFRYFQYDF